MEFKLDDQQKNEIQTYIVGVIKDAIKQGADSERPYVTRKEAAKYFGVSAGTLSYWTSLGMPVAVVDGRKLYGKESITKWLASHETKIN